MRPVLALTLAAGLFSGGCFPHSARNRAIAEIAEGVLLAGGVGLEATVTTTADCQAELSPDPNCGKSGSRNSAIGVAIILTSLVGFIATISSAEDQSASPIVTNATPPVAPPPPSAPSPTPAPMPPPGPPSAPAPSGSAGLFSF